MKIINKTQYSTGYLKRIFQLSLKADNKIEGKFHHKLAITVTYRKFRKWVLSYYEKNNLILDEKYKYSGYAYFNTGKMRISIPTKNINPKYIAQIFIHELSHCRGYKHNSMGNWLETDISFLPENINISSL